MICDWECVKRNVKVWGKEKIENGDWGSLAGHDAYRKYKLPRSNKGQLAIYLRVLGFPRLNEVGSGWGEEEKCKRKGSQQIMYP